MLDGFAKRDPPSEKKLAVGVDVPEHCCRRGRRATSALGRAVGDLILIAFYFLLRVGEYTVKATRNDSKQTVQFRMKDVQFFRKQEGRLRPLPATASDEEILSADGVTLRLSNQKNGYKNACIHQEHNGRKICSPVRTVGRRFCHIRKYSTDPNTFLSAFFESQTTRGDVTDNDIRRELKAAAIALDYETQFNIPISRIDTHSLRAGGANALHLAGYSDREIMKMGRWRGKTFMEYIQEQLSTFTRGMSTNMSRRFHFVNIEGGVLRDITHSIVNA